jgi:hypothetical protein
VYSRRWPNKYNRLYEIYSSSFYIKVAMRTLELGLVDRLSKWLRTPCWYVDVKNPQKGYHFSFEFFQIVVFAICIPLPLIYFNEIRMSLGKVPQKLKKTKTKKNLIYFGLLVQFKVYNLYSINCNLENGLKVRNISSFYNKFLFLWNVN